MQIVCVTGGFLCLRVHNSGLVVWIHNCAKAREPYGFYKFPLSTVTHRCSKDSVTQMTHKKNHYRGKAIAVMCCIGCTLHGLL